MLRRFLIALALAASAGASARADLILEGSPETYTPGTPFEFQVRLPNVNDLSLYNLEWVFASSGPASAISAQFTPASAPGAYPFPTSDFFASGGGIFGSSYRFTISDFLLDPPGVDTVAGANDLLGTFRVTPDSTATGPIRISLEPATFQLDDSAGRPIATTLPGEVTIREEKISQVPAPGGVALALVGGALLLGRKRILFSQIVSGPSRAL